MEKSFFIILLLGVYNYTFGNIPYSLDSLRQLALQNNKTLLASKNKIEVAQNEVKAAKTYYLPSVSLEGSYIHNQKSVHLLSDDTRNTLNSLGGTTSEQITGFAQQLSAQSPQMAALVGSLATPLSSAIGGVGQSIVNNLQTSTYNIYAGAVVLTQPIYMGGRIRAYDRITQYVCDLLGSDFDKQSQEVIYSTDQAYWQVVSLSNKKKLAESYVNMLKHLDSDVQKMFREGVLTKAGTLTVSVKLNEAEMALTKVTDGLCLSRMLLCQLCGLDINMPITLEDEENEHFSPRINVAKSDTTEAFEHRKDLKLLRTTINIAEENVKLVRSMGLPTIAAFGGYNVMNPNVYDGFENKFAGNFNIGIALHVPLWNWGQNKYRVRAAKSLLQSQKQIYEDAKEKIALQVNQARFKTEEAQKKLLTAQKNVEKADENLRYANVGFRESVIATSDMLEAQTAWLQARTEYLDAEIDVRLTEIYLQKVQGKINNN